MREVSNKVADRVYSIDNYNNFFRINQTSNLQKNQAMDLSELPYSGIQNQKNIPWLATHKNSQVKNKILDINLAILMKQQQIKPNYIFFNIKI